MAPRGRGRAGHGASEERERETSSTSSIEVRCRQKLEESVAAAALLRQSALQRSTSREVRARYAPLSLLLRAMCVRACVPRALFLSRERERKREKWSSTSVVVALLLLTFARLSFPFSIAFPPFLSLLFFSRVPGPRERGLESVPSLDPELSSPAAALDKRGKSRPVLRSDSQKRGLRPNIIAPSLAWPFLPIDPRSDPGPPVGLRSQRLS